jgi:hypothetical protein
MAYEPLNTADFRELSSLGWMALDRKVERVAGIEPARSAWEADRLPLHHTRPEAGLRLPKPRGQVNPSARVDATAREGEAC